MKGLAVFWYMSKRYPMTNQEKCSLADILVSNADILQEHSQGGSQMEWSICSDTSPYCILGMKVGVIECAECGFFQEKPKAVDWASNLECTTKENSRERCDEFWRYRENSNSGYLFAVGAIVSSRPSRSSLSSRLFNSEASPLHRPPSRTMQLWNIKQLAIWSTKTRFQNVLRQYWRR